MIGRYLLLAVGLVGLNLSGCGSPPITQNTYSRDKPTFQANVIKDKRVETDPALATQVQLLEIRQTTVQETLMKIDVEVVNNTAYPCDFDYKFEWLDDTGMLMDTPSSIWNSQHIAPEENLSLVHVAPSGRCKDFRLKIQRSQRN